MKVTSLSCVLLLLTPWTAAYQAPPSMGFSRQAYTLTLNCIIFTKWTMYIGFWIPESVFQKIHYFIHWVRVCFRKSSAHTPPAPQVFVRVFFPHSVPWITYSCEYLNPVYYRCLTCTVVYGIWSFSVPRPPPNDRIVLGCWKIHFKHCEFFER